MTEISREVLLPKHFGFCEGVVAADDLLRDTAAVAKDMGINTVYGYHDIVHNQSVREEHEKNGAVFVDFPYDVPPKSLVVASAHGTAPGAKQVFAERGCLVLDAVCPLVEHTHKMVQRARRNGEHVLYVVGSIPGPNKQNIHDEVLGTMGHLNAYFSEDGEYVFDPMSYHCVKLGDNPNTLGQKLGHWSDKFRIITQTTLDADQCFSFREVLREAIQVKNPNAVVSVSNRGDVCLAVQRRQRGVNEVLLQIQKRASPGAFVVVTDPASKNGQGYFKKAHQIIEEAKLDIQPFRIRNAEELARLEPTLQDKVIGVTASASTPDRDVLGVLSKLGVDEATVSLHRPKFHLKHGDGTDLRNPENIRQIIQEWQVV